MGSQPAVLIAGEPRLGRGIPGLAAAGYKKNRRIPGLAAAGYKKSRGNIPAAVHNRFSVLLTILHNLFE